MLARTIDGFWVCLCLALALTGCGVSGGGIRLILEGGVLGDGGVTPGDGPQQSGGDMATMESACPGVPSGGSCLGDSQVQRCVVPTGQGMPKVITSTCQGFEMCQVVEGIAQCVARQGSCAPGSSKCAGPDTRSVCVGGSWQTEACTDCQESGLGAVCGIMGGTRQITVTFQYDVRGPNANYTDWGNKIQGAAQGALVVSYTHDANKNQDIPLSSAVTDGKGKVTISVPTNPGPDDSVVIWAVGTKPGGMQAGILFALAIPDVPDGEWDVSDPIPAGNKAEFWGWGYFSNSIVNGETITIAEADGSGAMRVFDYLRYVYNNTSPLGGHDGSPVVIWLRNNTEWSCGACFLNSPIALDGSNFDAQLFLPATARDQSYWSDAVTAHELGHWTMASYGTDPGEGGPHQEACPTYPGQAWSEGWATGFSSLARSSARYFDKQEGTFFWFDIDRRVYGDNNMWTRPKPGSGLLQLLDENEVSSMIFSMADNNMQPGLSLSSNGKFIKAIGSTRLNKKPYSRGYTRHTWTGACQRSNIVDTRSSTMMFADFLDALICSGDVTANRVNAATDPINHYPYDSANPMCQ